jgi:hypothetical protein
VNGHRVLRQMTNRSFKQIMIYQFIRGVHLNET